ncbi:MAG TPA: hypothetical protein VMG32_01075 [Anaeromyxobacteraceae bacterium]|nr:hypothetical protein [Anaeromyxobacteraceae bacterium]
MSRFQDVKRAFAAAQKRYDGYYSQCAYFAGAFSRALVDYFEWPRELVAWERPGAGGVAHVEDALALEEDTFWHLGLLLELGEGTPLRVALRFKKAGERYLLELFPGVEFEVAEPTAAAFEPVLEVLHEEIAAHYERGLELFLENRAAKLRIPYAVPEPRPLPARRGRS